MFHSIATETFFEANRSKMSNKAIIKFKKVLNFISYLTLTVGNQNAHNNNNKITLNLNTLQRRYSNDDTKFQQDSLKN